jgi:hypothetical protein
MTDLLLKLPNGAQPTRKVQRIGYIFCIGKNIEEKPQLLFKELLIKDTA